VKAVTMFFLSGIVVMLLVGVAGGIVLQDLGRRQAMREAERLATVAGEDLVQPRVTNGILRGSSVSLLRLETVVVAVLQDPIEHMRLCDTSGRILYSDLPELIDSSCPLEPALLDPATGGDVEVRAAELASAPAPFGPRGEELLEVAVPLETPNGQPLLLLVSMRSDSVLTSARTLWRPFLPVMGFALLALAILQIPLAYQLARKVSRSQQEQGRLLERAVASADVERRRLAADLHDGPVQLFSSVAMTLAARAEHARRRDDLQTATALSTAAEDMREGIRGLRSALVSAYPPSIGTGGLGRAVADLAVPLRDSGIRCFVDIPRPLALPETVEKLLFRASQEAMRNVVAHSKAQEATVRVWKAGEVAGIEIRDDGVGFEPGQDGLGASEGHLGLQILHDLARDAGASLLIESQPGEGTTVRLEVPLP
jgi:signal transduction histidine kinase